MAYHFFGVYIEDGNRREYRIGFYDNNNYQPIIEERRNGVWTEINQRRRTGSANQLCRLLRRELAHNIPFSSAHTQNERVELINQLLYNIQRRINENVNYRGAHR